MDRPVQVCYDGCLTATTLTPKGEATRARIVEAAADLMLARGVGGTSLDDIRAGTATSKSQLFHYFPGGKGELVGRDRGVAERARARRPAPVPRHARHAGRRGTAGATPSLAHYGSQPHWGCPIGALVGELAGSDPALAAEVAAHMDALARHLQTGVERMRAAGRLRADADPEALRSPLFASLQGGLLLTQTHRSVRPLEAALDGALAALRAAAVCI